MDTLITHIPANVHLLIASRNTPPLNLARLRANHVLAELDGRALSFTSEEILQLYDRWNMPLESNDVSLLSAKTEGWAAGLVLFYQLAQQSPGTVSHLIKQLHGATDYLYDYLASEVFEQQPPKLRSFLLHTCLLSEMTPEFCDALLEICDAEQMLNMLEDRHLFTSSEEVELSAELGVGLTAKNRRIYRYHPLFAELLRAKLTEVEGTEAVRKWHLRIGRCFEKWDITPVPWGDAFLVNEALRHYFSGKWVDEAVKLLEHTGQVLEQYNLQWNLGYWVTQLPPERVQCSLRLQLCYAAELRGRGQIDKAMNIYEQAEPLLREQRDISGVCWVLYGIAQCCWRRFEFRKTIELAREMINLQEKYNLDEWMSQAQMMLTLAMAKQGDWRKVAETFGKSYQWSFIDSLLGHFRRGEFRAALEFYEDFINRYSQVMPGNVYNVLGFWTSLQLAGEIYTIQGKYNLASARLEKALGLAETLGYAYLYYNLAALGRLAVAKQQFNEAQVFYERAMRVRDSLAQEGDIHLSELGMSALFLQMGNLNEAQEYAEKSLQLARTGGHPAAIAESLRQLGRVHHAHNCFDDAESCYLKVLEEFHAQGKQYELCVTYFALAVNARELNAQKRCYADECLRIAETCGYEFLFPQHRPDTLPLLRWMAHEFGNAYAQAQLNALREPLRIRLFGQFSVERGETHISEADWKRRKVKTLFKFLMAHHPRPVHREIILETLWGELDFQKAYQNFKVTLGQLRRALEPDLRHGADSSYVIYREEQCSLCLGGCCIDTEEFEEALTKALTAEKHCVCEEAITMYQAAIELYTGDYLEDEIYSEWASYPRTYYRAQFETALLKLAHAQMQQKQYTESVAAYQRLLRLNYCNEEAHRGLMLAYARNGNRGAALKQYQICATILYAELDAKPSHDTVALYQKIQGRRRRTL